MEKIFYILLFFGIPLKFVGCSCGTINETFCSSIDTSDVIVLVEVISNDIDFITVVLVEELQKSYSNDTFVLKGQDGFNCNISVDGFDVGSYLIANLSARSMATTNDTTGVSYCGINHLIIRKDSVIGKIDVNLNSMQFHDFKMNLPTCALPNSVEEDSFSSKTRVYPSMVKDILNIKADRIIMKLLIYNINGELVYNEKPNSRDVVMETSRLDSGLYLVLVKTGKGLIRSRFMKL